MPKYDVIFFEKNLTGNGGLVHLGRYPPFLWPAEGDNVGRHTM